jgi:hypothetical protein
MQRLHKNSKVDRKRKLTVLAKNQKNYFLENIFILVIASISPFNIYCVFGTSELQKKYENINA